MDPLLHRLKKESSTFNWLSVVVPGFIDFIVSKMKQSIPDSLLFLLFPCKAVI